MRMYVHIACVSLVLAFMSAAGAKAQQQKIAYVNTDLILQEIPEYQGLQQQLTVLSRQWNAALEQMQQEIDQLKDEFEAKKILYTDEVRSRRQQQIQQKISARRQFIEEKLGPGGEYFQTQKELLEPIQRRIYEAIIAVAQREEIDFVFDRAKNATLLYAQKPWNLNEEILSELGVSLGQ